MEIVKISIKDLKPYENNVKKHPREQIEQIKSSIKKFGNNDPIAVDENYVIIEGHGRYEALCDLGYKEAECIILKGLTEEQKNAYRLVHNKLTMNTDFELDGLIKELDKITKFDMSEFDFDLKELDKELSKINDEEREAKEDNYDFDKEVEPIVKRGQIWKLGEHRLMCGDSTSKEDVSKLCGGGKIDLVFTDPPYGMKKESDGVLNDNLNFDDLLDFNKKWIPLSFEFLKDNGSWYCWGIDEPLMDIYSEILKPKIKNKEIAFRNLITWDKGNGQGQMSKEFRMYPIADEKCLFVMVGSESCQGFSVNAEDYSPNMEPLRLYLLEQRQLCGWDIPTMKRVAGHSDLLRDHWTSKSQFALPPKEVYSKFQAWAKEHGIEAFKRDYDELKRDFYGSRSFFDNTHDNMNNVWHFARTSQDERELTGGHATPKPLALCARAIKSSSREKERVLDLFGGSGSTLIACEQLDRICYMMELDPHYCDVIINRWETLTGKKAELTNE